MKGIEDIKHKKEYEKGMAIAFSSDIAGSNGFGLSTTQISWDSSSATSKRIGWENRSGPALKAVTADGTTLATSSDLDSHITYDELQIMSIFVDDAADTAYFYINGTLRSTLSTNTLLNNSGTIYWNQSYGNGNIIHAISEFIVSYEK